MISLLLVVVLLLSTIDIISLVNAIQGKYHLVLIAIIIDDHLSIRSNLSTR
jgi:hypothetical protein